MFTPIFLLKRLLFAAVCTYLNSATLFAQFICVDLISMVTLAHFLTFWPMESNQENFTHVYNEISFLVCGLWLYSFTQYTIDAETPYMYGNMLISWIGLAIAINFVFLVHKVVTEAIDGARRFWAKRL